MNNPISEQLRNLDLIKRGRVNADRVDKLTHRQVVDIAKESLILTSAENCTQELSPYSHTASLSLSGERWPCSSFECRQERLRQSAYFGALFSDRLYIRNFFGNCTHDLNHGTQRESDKLKRMVFDDIRLYLQLEPLIDEGIIRLISPPHYCPQCLSPVNILSAADKEKVNRARRTLEQRFLAEANLSLGHEADQFRLVVTGPRELVHDGTLIYRMKEPPYNLDRCPRVLSRVCQEAEVALNKRVRSTIRFDEYLADTVIDSAVFQLACSQCLNTAYLSESPVEFSVIQSFGGPTRTDQLLAALTSEIPFIRGLSPEELVKLRRNESDSYQVFRKALRDAVQEFLAKGGRLSKAEVGQLYGDIIVPELAKVEVSLKAARRRALKAVGRDVLGWTAAISASAYAGLLPASLTAAAGALGFTKIVANLVSGSMQGGEAQEDIRREKMFFLWKVRRKAGKKTNSDTHWTRP